MVVADDSNNPETLSTLQDWTQHDKVRIIRPSSRDGFKGGALQNAISHLGPRTTHLLIFDADFIPDPEVLTSLLTSFEDEHIAAVQGHQGQGLNAERNWVTKAVHASSASGFTTDLYARGRLGSFIQLGGTVMMIRRDALDAVGGFNQHLAEDFDLTLRLYLASYKILYREGISVAECPSKLIQVVRQNLRWSQGVTAAITQHAPRILTSNRLNRLEKMDLFLFGTSHLQAILFVMANILSLAILIANTPTHHTISSAAPIPLYLALSGPTRAIAGLYKDSSLRRSHWILYAILLAYILAPSQAYGGLKGLFTVQGFWHRTPETGLVTQNGPQLPQPA